MKNSKNSLTSKRPIFRVGEVVIAADVTKSDKLNDPGNLGWMTDMSSEIGKRECWLKKADSNLTNFLNDIKSQ